MSLSRELMYLFAFMLRQAIGVPQDSNGPHAYFNQYNIDAISLDVDRGTFLDDHYEAEGGSVISFCILLHVYHLTLSTHCHLLYLESHAH